MKPEPLRTTVVDELPKDGNSLLFYVLYWNPSDHPERFVVRRQTAGRDGIRIEAKPLIVTEDLAAARAAIPPGLFRLDRDPSEELQILETWV